MKLTRRVPGCPAAKVNLKTVRLVSRNAGPDFSWPARRKGGCAVGGYRCRRPGAVNPGVDFTARFTAGSIPFPFLSRPVPEPDVTEVPMSIATVEELTEQILYRLSLDPRARELAVRLLERLRGLIGDLPASADHHHRSPGGLYQHSLEVSAKMLKEFEGHIIMERKSNGSVDSFQSARNRPRWQYASFVAALCHDLRKVFDMEVRSGRQRWFPLHITYRDFARRTKEAHSIVWREEREHGAHAVLSPLLLYHLFTAEDLDYLGLTRLVHVAESLAGSHQRSQASPLAGMLNKLDQASVKEAQVSMAREADSKIGCALSRR